MLTDLCCLQVLYVEGFTAENRVERELVLINMQVRCRSRSDRLVITGAVRGGSHS